MSEHCFTFGVTIWAHADSEEEAERRIEGLRGNPGVTVVEYELVKEYEPETQEVIQ